jgi:ATP-dependent DNA helicase DinG
MAGERIQALTYTSFFKQHGQLSAVLPTFEARPQQLRVAEAVQRALRQSRHLLVEAGTGSGKTLAYLVPAVESGDCVVLSTATRTLQEQIVLEDIPLLARALGKELAVAVMKGRTNYLCELFLTRAQAQRSLFGSEEAEEMARISAWASITQTGDRAEIPELRDDSPLWHKLTANSEQCLARMCPAYERCWVMRMRGLAQQAQLVVVNHHLYFADAALRLRRGEAAASILPPHAAVIFDEAHEVEEIAAQHFGCQVSDARLMSLILDVRVRIGDDPALKSQIEPSLACLERASTTLFDHAVEGRRKIIGPLDKEGTQAWESVDAQLEAVEARLAGSDAPEARQLATRAAGLAADLAYILQRPTRPGLTEETVPRPGDEAVVRFAERSGRTRVLQARPINVASVLENALAGVTAIFVSATLRVDESFEFVRERLGLSPMDEVAVGSPFDFSEQTVLYAPSDLPDPREEGFGEAAAERARLLVTATAGGAFVLCTSYRMLPLFFRALAPTGLRLYVQGDAPRHQLLEEFKRDGNAVLIATLSFWQGIDVPGAALRLVIIDKIPFSPPDDPLTAGCIELLRRQGRDPFRAYQVPRAALLLMQGFGRLIRRQTDRGLVAILDPRLTSRSYGGVLLRSLPGAPVVTEIDQAKAYALTLAVDFSTSGDP